MQSKFRRKRQSRNERKGAVLHTLVGVILLAGLAILYIWQRMETLRLVKDNTQVVKQIEELEKTKEVLNTNIARLTGPEHIYQFAQTKLGMGTTDYTRLVALADPVQPEFNQRWQRLLADLKQYGQKAWDLAEPQAMAREKHD